MNKKELTKYKNDLFYKQIEECIDIDLNKLKTGSKKRIKDFISKVDIIIQELDINKKKLNLETIDFCLYILNMAKIKFYSWKIEGNDNINSKFDRLIYFLYDDIETYILSLSETDNRYETMIDNFEIKSSSDIQNYKDLAKKVGL